MKKIFNGNLSYWEGCKKIVRIMKLTALFLFVGLLQVSAFSYSQNARISLEVNDAELKEVINAIQKQTEFIFFYSPEDLKDVKNLNLKVHDAKLQEVLEKCFENTDLEFEIRHKAIVLKKALKKELLPDSGEEMMPLQKKTVSGKVTDEKGLPLPGVSVMVKGTAIGITTDVDGNYALEIPDEAAVLVFSFVGMRREEVNIGGQSVINVTMAEDLIGIDEVVAVGYGVQKKINLTGSVASINGDVLDNRPVPNVGTGLQGLLPGVTVTSSSGQPGNSGTSILVRGVNTINSQTNPLILIDGVAGGDINLLNPDDIESVSVLKDAASSAIYGARAANGVILVTTKQGKNEGKAAFSYNGYYGVQTPISLPELVNGREYMMLENEARSARGVAIPYSEEAFMMYDSKNFPNDYSNTDWIAETYKKFAAQQSHNINIQGKVNKSSYYMSYGYLEQNGLIIGDPYYSSRNNVRLRLNTQVADRLKVDGNLSFVDFYRKDAGGNGTAGVFRLTQRISPLLPVKWQLPTEDGGWTDSPYWSYGSVTNPVRTAYESGYLKSSSRTFNGNFNATLDLIEGMNINTQYAYNYYTRDIKDWNPTMPRFLADGTPHPSNDNVLNSIAVTHRSILTQTLATTLNYSKKIKQHDLKFLAGFSQEWAYLPVLYGSRKKILLDGVEEIDGGTEDIVNSGSAEHWALRSYFGRINYDFAERYLFEANVRYDGTSRFAKENRWGFFPSFSAGWKFSEESFMEFAEPILALGKLRVSWGELGNQNISNSYYPYLTEIERVTKAYPIGGQDNVGFKQYSLANENIKWETIRMFNVGADLNMLDNRMNFTFDWFKKTNINALLKPIYPTIIGITSSANLPLENIGSIENKGWEITLGWRDKIGNVQYGLTANLSDARNKITDMGTSAPSLGNNIRRVGDPINAYYGYLTDGLAQVDDFESYDETSGKYLSPKFPVISSYANIIQPGDIIYRDINGEDGKPDGKIDEYDKVVFGDPYPRYSYSLRGFANWKNFDFSFYLQGVGKVNGYLRDEARHAFLNDYSIPKKSHLDRWTPNNTDASYPRMYYQADHNIVFSDYWVEDASYLRLKNIQLGYTLPKHLTDKMKISRAKVYLSADNLFTITNYFGGFDPEVRETSGDEYPQLKTFALGVQLGF
ncbi:TonB-dependent receptor [Maribellus sp. CM-23]|uniref:TonB-dependent receptor n=1 Tax=Maribellus sp. CM-23 TaxID=2781026 RepID=UPI001F464BD2|nr:TonB-dependent receptor [Maribellus sp. CM-23]